MKKLILQGLIIISLFFFLWITLSKVDWITLFKVSDARTSTEEKLGDLFWDLIKKSEKEVQNNEITQIVDSIITKICIANEIDQNQIKLHVTERNEINAFVLPNKHLIIFSGLLSESENAEELSGVICHELAHMELNHVMKKLIKEIGLSVLITMTTSNTGSELVKESVKLLSSSAYDRKLEEEADIKAIDYLIKSNIDPEPFADFLYKMATNESNAGQNLTWINTHPDSKERAEYLMAYIANKPKMIQPILTKETWKKLKEAISN
jgi:beta-barrel assembly-enhancing protease